MGNIFSSQLTSIDGNLYKVDLFADAYVVDTEFDVTGGSGSVFYVASDVRLYFREGEVAQVFDTGAWGASPTIGTVTYNSASNRTEITLTSLTYTVNMTKLRNKSIVTDEPTILDIKTDWEKQGDIILAGIKASSTTVVYSNGDNYFDWFLTYYLEATDLDLKLLIYKDDSGISWDLDWVGNIVIDLLEWDNHPKPRPITFKAIDGLDMLKDVPYSEVTTSPSDRTIMAHIKRILDKNDLAQFWGASDDYLREAIEFSSNDVASLTNQYSPLDYSYVSDSYFVLNTKNSYDDGMSCYDALKSLIELFSCRIFISQGVYWVQQVRNYDATAIVSRRFFKDGTVRTVGRTFQYNHKITARSSLDPSLNRSTNLVVMGSGKFNYLPGLKRVILPIRYNKQMQYPLPPFQLTDLANPNSITETMQVYGGVGTGSILNLKFRVTQTPIYALAGSFCRVKVEIYGTSGATTYYISGGGGSTLKWATTPYAKLYYEVDVKSLGINQSKEFSLVTPEIPFDGTMTVKVTATHVDWSGTTITIPTGKRSFVISNILLTVAEDGGIIEELEVDNAASNYTKDLILEPLIITDSSNKTSINVVSVDENYVSGSKSLVKSTTWDADYPTDETLAGTRAMEAMSLQYRPIEMYRGKFVGSYYAQNTIGYNGKAYFFNGFRKDYKSDEVSGEWIEQANLRTGLGVTEYEGWEDSEDRTGDEQNNSAMIAHLNNTRVLTTLDADLTAGTITSLTIVAIGATRVYEGDVIQLIDPVTGEAVEEFTTTADVGSEATTISVASKATTVDIPLGTFIALKESNNIDTSKIKLDKLHFKSTTTPTDVADLNDGEAVIDAGNIYIKSGSTIYIFSNSSSIT